MTTRGRSLGCPVTTPGPWAWNVAGWLHYTQDPVTLRRAGTSTFCEMGRAVRLSEHEAEGHSSNVMGCVTPGRAAPFQPGTPAGIENHPVVYVDLDDARAYAAWAGKRLPSEGEWQFAAQGADGLRYPWGNEMKPSLCNGGETGGTTPVKAFPGGRSPFGCYDMCGNVWEWTGSEYNAAHTRFVMLRGGSYFKAAGSAWYMDGGPQPCRFAAKMLLMWPGLDRCATVGFRCAVDLAPPAAL